MLQRMKIILTLSLLLAGCAPMKSSLMQNSIFSTKDESSLYYSGSYTYLKELNTKFQNFEVNAATKGVVAGTLAGAAVGAAAGALTGDAKNAALGGILGGMAGGSAAYIYVMKNKAVFGNPEERFLHYLADAKANSENFRQVNKLTREGIRSYTRDMNDLNRNRKKYSSMEYRERLQEISDGLSILRKFYGLGGEEYFVVKNRYANVVNEEKKIYSDNKKSKSISQSEYDNVVSKLKKTEIELNMALMLIDRLQRDYTSLEKQLDSSEEEVRRLEVNILVMD